MRLTLTKRWPSRKLLAFIAVMLVGTFACALANPRSAYANPSNELKLTVTILDQEGNPVDGDKSITVFKNNDTSTYEYKSALAREYCRYRYTENLVHWNTYYGQAWSSRTDELRLDGMWMHWFPPKWDKWLEVQLSMAKLLESCFGGQELRVAAQCARTIHDPVLLYHEGSRHNMAL